MLISFLIAVAAMCGLATFLAVLMVIADLTVGNYGEVKVIINNETEMTVEGGKSLLGTLMGEKLFIPSACGGRGSCGFCKVKVVSDIGDYVATELPWITEEEK